MDKATNFFDVKKEEEVVEEQSKNTPHKQTLSEFDRDEKYSKFRYDFPFSQGRRDLYCTDIDWVEWRKGNPRAIVEVTRCFGKNQEEVADDYLHRNNGFQAEVAYRIAKRNIVKAYLVVIDDQYPFVNDDYESATFYIYELISIKKLKYWISYKGGREYFNKFLKKI